MLSDLSPNDAKQIERYLFRLSGDEGVAEAEDECNVQLEVLEAGQWIIKFRRHGIIVNNCDLVLRDGIKIDASVSFFTLGNFWATINGAMTLDEGAMSTSGSEMAMNLFRTKVLKYKLADVAAALASPARVVRLSSSLEEDNKLPLRSGWLLKKRDLFTGWRSRYFKVFVGRVEYYAEPRDTVPRAVIPLLNAKITPAAEIRINREGKSYQIIVEPRLNEKCFKLASELTGEDGKQDAESWFMAFDIATKPAAQAHALLSGTQMLPSTADPHDPSQQMGTRSKSKEFKAKSAKAARVRVEDFSVGFALAALAALIALAGSLSWALPPFLPALSDASGGANKLLHVSVAFALGASAVVLLGLLYLCLSKARDDD